MNNIVLSGFAGTGKTTIGRHLASRLNLTFVDMDQVIEQRQGRAIRTIFEQEGEPFFRRLERDLCHDVAQWQGYVIATGGGTLVDSDNLAILRPTNLVICLDAQPEELWRRLSQNSDRPLLDAHDMEEKKRKLLDLLHARAEAYARIEHHIETTGREIREIVDEIVALWETEKQ